jgi:hypothetical protein
MMDTMKKKHKYFKWIEEAERIPATSIHPIVKIAMTLDLWSRSFLNR